MNISAIDKFERIKDVLIFVLNSEKPVKAIDIENFVLDMSRTTLNNMMRQIVESGYLNADGGCGGKIYTATDRTRQLFGGCDDRVADMGFIG